MLDRNRGYAFGGGTPAAGVALTTAYALIAVTEDPVNSPRSSPIPRVGFLSSLELQVKSIAGAASATFKLTRDPEGNSILVPGTLTGATQTLETGEGDATKGGCSFALDMDYFFIGDLLNPSETAGTLYVWVKLDAGSATGWARLGWRA